VQATPQSIFMEFQLIQLVPTKSNQPGMNAVITEKKLERRLEILITEEGFKSVNYGEFAKEVVAEIVQSGVLNLP